MYKLVLNPNRILIVLALAAGLAAVFYFPPRYPDKFVEIPLVAIFVGEMGLALFASLIFFENANPMQIISLASSMLGISMMVGAVGNWSGQLTQMLPDSFVMVSWVQLVIMNASGVLGMLSMYRLQTPEEPQSLKARLTEPPVAQPAAQGRHVTRDTVDSPGPQDFTPPAASRGAGEGEEDDPKRTQSVKEILEGLDISRIMRLERSIHPPEPPSLENLFKEESHAAESAAGAALEATGTIILPGGEPPKRLTTDDSERKANLKVADEEAKSERTAFARTIQDQPVPSQEAAAPSAKEKSTGSAALSELLKQGAQPAGEASGEAGLKSRYYLEPEEPSFSTEAKSGANKPAETRTRSGAPLASDEPIALGSASAAKPTEAAKSKPTAATPSYEFGSEYSFGTKSDSPAAEAIEEPVALAEGPVPLAEPIALAEAPVPLDEPIALAEAPVPLDDPIALADAPVPLDEPIALADAPVPLDEPIALADAPVPLDEPIALADAPVPLDEPIALADAPVPLDEPETEAPFVVAGKGIPENLPSLQELLKSEPMTGPLVPIEEEEEAPPPVAEEVIAADSTLEFDEEVVDVELNEAFKKLVPKEALRNVSPETLKQLRESHAQERATAESDSLDSLNRSVASTEIADLIKSLAEEEKLSSDDHQPVEQEPATPIKTSEPKEVKDFGRLSARASAKASPETDTGGMKTIGKMLIDAQAVENIIKQGEKRTGGMTTARVVSARRGEAIRSLLTYIDQFSGVTGSLIVGNDGLVISSTVDPSIDKDLLGAMSLAIHGNSEIATGKINLGSIQEIVLESTDRLTVLKKLEDGILAVFSDSKQAGRIDGLLKLLASLLTRGKPAEGDAQAATPATDKQAAQPAKTAAQPAPAQPVPASPRPASANQSGEADDSSKRPVTPQPPDSQQSRAPVAADLVRDLIASLSSSKDPEATASSESTPPAGKPAPQPADRQPAGEKANAQPAPGKAISGDNLKPASTGAKAEGETPKANQAVGTAGDAAQAATAKTVKEFGRLSSSSANLAAAPVDSGTMSIGKMLLDVQAVTNIIKTAEKRGVGLTTARVISAARGEGIRSLLSRIDNFPGVSGTLIVGHDGLVIASTLGSAVDKDTIGAMATSIHSHTNVVTQKLELGRLQQTIMQSAGALTILTNVEVGVLAVLCETGGLANLDGLLEAIEATVQT
jgi:predicted regulator of Ras-like GTPase activity (Roadblock/LC7/MglB family)